ncbi:MAG: HD-GYP domain-containing protein [Acidobacteria bacterium]|nr:MAG: HD-GYP domain-containing protein [Acidobacteriota bacterium]
MPGPAATTSCAPPTVSSLVARVTSEAAVRKRKRKRSTGPRSLNWDLVRLFAVAAAIPLLVVGGLLLLRARQVERDSRQLLLNELAKLYAYQASERLEQIEPATSDLRNIDWDGILWGSLRTSTLRPEMSLHVFDANGVLRYRSPGAVSRATGEAGADDEGGATNSLQPFLDRLRQTSHATAVVQRPLRGLGNQSLTLVLTETPSEGSARTFIRRSFLLLVAALLATLLYVIPLIRRSLRPLAEIESQSERLVRGESVDEVQRPQLYAEYRQLYQTLERLSRSLSQRDHSLQLLDDVGEQMQHKTREEDIVETVLKGAPRVLRCASVVCLLFPERTAGEQAKIVSIDDLGRAKQHEMASSQLTEILDALSAGEPSTTTTALDPLLEAGMERQRFLVRIEGQVRAMLFADWPKHEPALTDRGKLGRSLARQLELALANLTRASELARFYSGAIGALARAIDAASPWTRGHSDRVSEMAQQFGTFLELRPSQIDTLREGGLVPDIGKIALDRSILDKKGALTPGERRQVEKHPEIGHQILQPIPGFEPVLLITLEHHEWWNGNGYPHGRRGDEIDLLARIISLVDVFDALTSSRPYRGAYNFFAAADLIREGAGTQFDPELASRFLAFLHLIEREVPSGQLELDALGAELTRRTAAPFTN